MAIFNGEQTIEIYTSWSASYEGTDSLIKRLREKLPSHYDFRVTSINGSHTLDVLLEGKSVKID